MDKTKNWRVSMIFWGVALAIVSIVGLFLASVWLYFTIRRKFAHSKFLVEAFFIGVALLTSIATKFAVQLVVLDGETLEKGFIAVIQAIYGSIGGLTFEGLIEFEGTIVPSLLQCLYYGSSIYAGAMTLFVISAKASYEFYGLMQLLRRDKNRDIYVLTAVTDETVHLAKDIKKHYQQQLEVYKKDKKSVARPNDYMVVFASPNLEPFDGKDELCREIMAHGFVYWSYVKDKSHPKSIAKSLFLNNKNRENYSCRFVVFAFGADNHIPQEEENMDIIFDDIHARLLKDDGMRIEYVLLTKRTINYQAYDYHNRTMLLDFAKVLKSATVTVQLADKTKEQQVVSFVSGDQVDQGLRNFVYASKQEKKALEKSGYKKYWSACEAYLVEQYSKRIILDVWNESETIGKQTVQRLAQMGLQDQLIANNAGLLVWALGFGSTGQSITNDLFVQTSALDDKGLARDFAVEVFDPSARQLGGLFAFEHPCFAHEDSVRGATEKQSLALESLLAHALQNRTISEQHFKDYTVAFHKFFANVVSLAESKHNKAQQSPFDGEMPTPVYRFNNVACTDFDFFTHVDNVTGREVKFTHNRQLCLEILDILNGYIAEMGNDIDPEFGEALGDIRNKLELGMQLDVPDAPNIIVVATGDDYRNVLTANAIIQDVSNEKQCRSDNSGGRYHGCKQYIVVNIWNRHNNALLINGHGVWNESHTVLTSDNLVVIVVGNNDEIYTYGEIVEHSVEENYHCVYSCMSDWLNECYMQRDDVQMMYNWLVTQYKKADVTTEEEKLAVGQFWGDCINVLASVFAKISNRDVSTTAEVATVLANLEKISKKTKFQGLQNLGALKFVGETMRLWFDQHDTQLPQRSYAKISIWEKSSNRSASLFAPMHNAKYMQQTNGEGVLDNAKIFAQLSAWEHQRWVRFHLAHGWTFFECQEETKRELCKQHNCIKPFADLSEWTIFYDSLNVIWAILKQ